MANAFKNRTLRDVGTTATAVGAAVAANTETTLIGMTIANTTSGVINVTVTLTDNAGTPNVTHLVLDAPVPTGGSLVVLGGDQKVCLQFVESGVGDTISVISNTANSMHVVLSYLEIS